MNANGSKEVPGLYPRHSMYGHGVSGSVSGSAEWLWPNHGTYLKVMPMPIEAQD